MDQHPESPLEQLWEEYGTFFKDFDDLTLARWMAQTLGQLEGRVCRLSHPLVGAYRLAAQHGHRRGIWLQRLAYPPAAYPEAECCRAPLVPLVTRDALESGLVCQHCLGTAVAFGDLAPEFQDGLKSWAEEYAKVHQVAHWDDRERKSVKNYDRAYENAAKKAEGLLARLGRDILPPLLGSFPLLIWEDQDECLEVRPEDLSL